MQGRVFVMLIVGAVGCSLASLDGYAGDAASTPDGGVVPSPEDAATRESSVEASTGPVRSCLELKERDPAAQSGVYELEVEGARFRVYCEMTVDRGGWTLIGRSGDNDDDDPFGWSVEAGSLENDRVAYSLDVVGKKIEFTEALLTKRDEDRKIIERAYRIGISRAQVAERQNTAFRPTVTTILGDCTEPDMLVFSGHTRFRDRFFFRDEPTPLDESGSPYGFFASGFRLAYNDCRGAGMDGAEGMLLVR